MKDHNYFVYITTNANRKVLYTGVTNDLEERMLQHFNQRGNKSSFTGRYYCYNLVYFERYTDVNHAIEREKRDQRVEKRKENCFNRIIQS